MDEARKKLAATLSELRAVNDDLERQVVSRTKVLKAQYENLRLLHDVSQVSTRERAPDRFVPEILLLIAEHYSFRAAAMVTAPHGAPSATYVFPREASLDWLVPGADPPRGWERRDLIYQGISEAQLFYCRVEDGEPVMEALQHQIAMSLHGARLLKRTLAQDAQRKILVRRLLDAGEAERRRIARELHDEISQLLTLIQLSLDDVSPASAEIGKAKDLLGKTQQEVHRIIYDLRPSLLDDLGLSAAVKWYATNYLVQQGLQVSLEIEEDVRVSPEIEIVTFRICQEAITNILRHSRAENVSIELYVDGDRLMLGVEDDGVGFAARETLGGAGIVGMRERAELVNGSITIDSEPGTGTNVLLEIPLKS
jgi:signal transduction histidine kinase